MAVLTLAGKAINWDKPPKPTDKVMWSQRDQYGRAVTGSLRTIAHLDHLDMLARKKFNSGIVVLQPPYNTGVAASAGTHDYDGCLDVYIPGVDWWEQQAFFRANGAGAYYRRPPAFGHHIHYFTLPPRKSADVRNDYAMGGFKVGKYVDGGYSLYGRIVASSQVEDYYKHRTALSGHAHDPSWFPADIAATIFNLNAYIVRQRNAVAKANAKDEIAILGSHGPLARLGGEAGQELWDTWEQAVRKRANANVRAGRTVFINSDTNKHGALPKFGAALRRLGGKGIDLIAMRRATGGASVKVLKRKVVRLPIDRHDGYGVKVRVRFPSGKRATFWLVQANLGRGVSDAVFEQAARALRKAFGRNAIYTFNEIDEADAPKEHQILREVFPRNDFKAIGWATFCPTLVGRKIGRGKLEVSSSNVTIASKGMAKVSPLRVVVETVLATKK